MYDFVVQLVFVVSLGLLVYLLALAMPRVADDEENGSKFRKWLANIPLEKLDEFLIKLGEKSLRKIRVVILKIDNSVSGKLARHGKRKINN